MDTLTSEKAYVQVARIAEAEAYYCHWSRKQTEALGDRERQRIEARKTEWLDVQRDAATILWPDPLVGKRMLDLAIMHTHRLAAEHGDGPVDSLLRTVGWRDVVVPKLVGVLGLPTEVETVVGGFTTYDDLTSAAVTVVGRDESFLSALMSDEPRWVDPIDGY